MKECTARIAEFNTQPKPTKIFKVEKVDTEMQVPQNIWTQSLKVMHEMTWKGRQTTTESISLPSAQTYASISFLPPKEAQKMQDPNDDIFSPSEFPEYQSPFEAKSSIHDIQGLNVTSLNTNPDGTYGTADLALDREYGPIVQERNTAFYLVN